MTDELKVCRQCLETHTACRAHRKLKNGGGPCHSPPMPNGTCQMHGGKSLKGIAHPNYQTGAHSRYRPRRLQVRLDRALADPEPLKFLYDAQLITARIDELLERLDEQEHTSLALWEEAN